MPKRKHKKDNSSDSTSKILAAIPITEDRNAAPSNFDGCWIYCRSSNGYKYKLPEYNPDSIGKWMLFYHRREIDKVWRKIKQGIEAGELWEAKVSGRKPTDMIHAIMVYTPDFEDLEDVVRVHDCLVRNELNNKTLYYKTDSQTRAGIYAGGNQRHWIYNSKMVEELRLKSKTTHSEQHEEDEPARSGTEHTC